MGKRKPEDVKGWRKKEMVVSEPPPGGRRIYNLWWDPETGQLVWDADDE